MTIREAAVADCESVLALWRAAGAPPSVTDTVDDLRRVIGACPDLFLVAEASGRLVGTVLGGWDHWRAYVYRLVVDPTHRHRGVARTLVERLEPRLHARGARRIHALAATAAGADFFASLGYERTVHADFARALSL